MFDVEKVVNAVLFVREVMLGHLVRAKFVIVPLLDDLIKGKLV